MAKNQILEQLIKQFSPKITPKIEIIFFGLVFIIFSFLFYNMISGLWFPNTDNIQNFVFSKNFAEHNTLVYQDELNQRFKPAIFGVRGMVIRDDGSAVPTSMPGYILILGLVRKIADNLVYFVNPLFAVLALLYLYKISQLIFPDKRLSFLVIILASISAPFLFVANIPFNNIIACAFFLAGLYYLLKIIPNSKQALPLKELILFSIFAGLGIWIRYEIIIFYLPVLIWILISLFLKPHRRFIKTNLWRFLLSIAILGIFLFLLIIFNIKLYGNYTGIYSHTGNELRIAINQNIQVTRSEGIGFWLIRPDLINKLIVNFKNQIFYVNPFIAILFLLSLFTFFKNKPARIILFSFILIILFQFWFYLGLNWSGSSFSGSVGTSYARYLLTSWLLMIILGIDFLAYLYQKIKFKNLFKFLGGMVLIITIVFNLNVFLNSQMAYNYFVKTMKLSKGYQKRLAKNTSQKSVIFCRISDRYIFPYRQTAIYSAIPSQQRSLKTVDLMTKLLYDGYQVYFIDEHYSFKDPKITQDINNIFQEIKNKNLTAAKTVIIPNMYQISFKEN